MTEPVEHKVITQAIAHALVLVVAFLAARWGWDLNEDVAGLVAAGCAVVAGAVVGWLTRHTPRLSEALDALAEHGVALDPIPDGPTDVRPDADEDDEDYDPGMGDVLIELPEDAEED